MQLVRRRNETPHNEKGKWQEAAVCSSEDSHSPFRSQCHQADTEVYHRPMHGQPLNYRDELQP